MFLEDSCPKHSLSKNTGIYNARGEKENILICHVVAILSNCLVIND